MKLLETKNYQQAILAYMEIAVDCNKPIDPVPPLKTLSIGGYEISVNQDEPQFRYYLNLAGKSVTLKELRELEQQLNTKLVG